MGQEGSRQWWSILLLLLLLAVEQNIQPCKGAIQEVSIEDDSRALIEIAAFGFTSRGRLKMVLREASWKSSSGRLSNDNDPSLAGFFLVSDDQWAQVVEELEQKPNSCMLHSRHIFPLMSFRDLDTNHQFNKTDVIPSANRYTLLFANCMPMPETQVSMHMEVSMYNLKGGKGDTRDYLSEGQTELPPLYFFFFIVYLILEVLWAYVCYQQRGSAHRIHMLMAVLVLLKAFYMFSEAEDKSYIKKTGTPHGWDIAFYTFSFLKGVMLFTVIVLVGTGWSFLKPYLQGKEKNILMIVIPLQVLANIGRVVLGETGPSGKDSSSWLQLLLLIDVICCCAVLFPIVWSIKHLREAARTDGKAARNLAKLTLFRQYYVVVVSYIYFTRIVILALTSLLSYRFAWVTELASETATLAFYFYTGYKFKPVPHNPYFVLDEDEEAAAEEALKDDDFEL